MGVAFCLHLVSLCFNPVSDEGSVMMASLGAETLLVPGVWLLLMCLCTAGVRSSSPPGASLASSGSGARRTCPSWAGPSTSPMRWSRRRRAPPSWCASTRRRRRRAPCARATAPSSAAGACSCACCREGRKCTPTAGMMFVYGACAWGHTAAVERRRAVRMRHGGLHRQPEQRAAAHAALRVGFDFMVWGAGHGAALS